MNTISEVVKEGLCSGCGVCAGVCPADCLQMQVFGGKYQPLLVGECLPRCNLCLNVCPFSDHDLLRDDIAKSLFGEPHGLRYDPATGYYLQAFVGHSLIADQRERGAAGGVATWLLERLVAAGEVDRVISVGSVRGPNQPLFEYQTCLDADQVRSTAGSKYYPVEISAALRSILRDPEHGRYAIVGLPCVLQGVRRATLKYPRLKRRVRFLLGLVCNHCPGSYYTEFLCALAGVSRSDVRTVEYRVKGAQRANDYGFRALAGDGTWSRSVWFQGLPSRIWNKQYFAYNACSYCDDLFAEMADVVFMDAWLEEFLPDTRGSSIVLVRNLELQRVLEDGCRAGLCDLSPCSIKDVTASQKNQLRRKKDTIRFRMMLRLGEGGWLPKMQVQPAAEISQAELRLSRQEAGVIRFSNKLWTPFRWLPASALPVYCWMVDRMAGNNDASIKIGLRALLVGVLKALSLYTVAASLKRRSISCKQRLSNQKGRCVERLAFGCARVFGWARGVKGQDPTKEPLSALILPPWSPASLGDEAVETAFVTGLKARDVKEIAIISYTAEDDWTHLGLVSSPINMQAYFRSHSWKELFRFLRTVGQYDRFYVLGTDVLDGAYNERDGMSRITLASLAAIAGTDTSIVGFSFNKNPSVDVVASLRSLPMRVHLCTRDPVSYDRLVHHLQRPVELTADIAFCLEPAQNSQTVQSALSWIRDQRRCGRAVVGINVSHHLFTVVPHLTMNQLVSTYVSALADLLYREKKVSFVLIPHAFNEGTNDLTVAQTILSDMPEALRLHSMLFLACRAAEVQALCAELDIVLSGRMHCAIACLSQGTPVACITYQDKFEGLFEHFGLQGMTIDPEVSLRSGKLLEFFLPIYQNRDNLRKQIEARLPAVRQLAEANFAI